MGQKDEHVYINPVPKYQPHQYTVIFLHGLGYLQEGWIDAFFAHEAYGLTPKNTRIVLPSAPMMKVTAKQEEPMHSWLDLTDIRRERMDSLEEIQGAYNQIDLNSSADFLLDCIEEEVRKLPEGRQSR